jgi:hypothetical protein
MRGDRYVGAALDDFAIKDGFESFAAMLAWFEQTHRLPFDGRLIEWGV